MFHDLAGHTLTIWTDDPTKEAICEETTREVVLMKHASGRVTGFELLHYRPERGVGSRVTLETGGGSAP